MRKQLALFGLFIVLLLSSSNLFSKDKIKKKKRSSFNRTSKLYRPNKHKRKSRHYRHSGNNVDLKSITTQSPFKDVPDNGVNPVETKPPGN